MSRRSTMILIEAVFQGYRCFVSPLLHGLLLFPGGCRFVPTCSAYGLSALRQYGLRRGLVVFLKRLARCHPWSAGGYDPAGIQNAKIKMQG